MTLSANTLAAARTIFFVPGHRDDKCDKAMAAATAVRA